MSSSANTTPLLAGVCSHLADLLHFKVWALRAVFVVLLLAKTVLAVIVYGVLALLFHAADRRRQPQDPARAQTPAKAPQPGPHDGRIRDLDRRFREWELSVGKQYSVTGQLKHLPGQSGSAARYVAGTCQ